LGLDVDRLQHWIRPVPAARARLRQVNYQEVVCASGSGSIREGPDALEGGSLGHLQIRQDARRIHAAAQAMDLTLTWTGRIVQLDGHEAAYGNDVTTSKNPCSGSESGAASSGR
jgi:hypothetical protein